MTFAVTICAMMKTSILARPAGRAIAAVLALATTPALAQDGAATTNAAPTVAAQDPVPIVVASQPAAAETPVPSLSVVVPEAVVDQGAAEASTADEAPVAQAPATPAAARTAAAPRIRQASPTAATQANPDQVDDTVVANEIPAAVANTADPFAVQSVADGPSAAPVSAEAVPEESGSELVLVGGGLAVALGLAGLLMAGASRRRRAARPGAATPVQTAPIEPRAQPVRTAPAAPAAPVAAPALRPGPGFVVTASNPAPTYASKWHSDGYVNASPAAPVAGRSVPNTPEGRKALIDRLVRARPDPTIPFTSSAARRRRARLIVQSLQHRLAEQPNLDFRRFYESFGRRHPASA